MDMTLVLVGFVVVAAVATAAPFLSLYGASGRSATRVNRARSSYDVFTSSTIKQSQQPKWLLGDDDDHVVGDKVREFIDSDKNDGALSLDLSTRFSWGEDK
jgi:hypothetical protein